VNFHGVTITYCSYLGVIKAAICFFFAGKSSDLLEATAFSGMDPGQLRLRGLADSRRLTLTVSGVSRAATSPSELPDPEPGNFAAASCATGT
jgi:hypothetical protein